MTDSGATIRELWSRTALPDHILGQGRVHASLPTGSTGLEELQDFGVETHRHRLLMNLTLGPAPLPHDLSEWAHPLEIFGRQLASIGIRLGRAPDGAILGQSWANQLNGGLG